MEELELKRLSSHLHAHEVNHNNRLLDNASRIKPNFGFFLNLYVSQRGPRSMYTHIYIYIHTMSGYICGGLT